MGSFWEDPKPWHEVFRGKWAHAENNNILEARGTVAAARHLARSSQNWDRKHLIFTGSLVVLGAFGKGRSSSPALLRQFRRWCTFRLLFGMRIYLRYVPTHLNHADGPSRGKYLGWHDSHEKPQSMRKQPEAYRGIG